MANHEPLTPEQLFALVESNARAIEALANQAAEDREEFSMGIAELRMAQAETDRVVTQAGRTVELLAQSVDRYFQGQANQNRFVSGVLEGHESRITQLEGGQAP